MSTSAAFERRSSYLVAGVVVLLVALSGLFYYKWGGALRTIGGVRAAGEWTTSAQGLTTGGVLSASLYYFRRIWLALVYGLLIGAAVRAFVSPRRVVSLLGTGGSLRRQLAGGVAGAPLMLCSCCITPIFSSVYERGARLGPALALMLASPGLNPAALALTFMLFPVDLALGRFGAALVAVFLLPVALEHLFGGSLVLSASRTQPAPEDDEPRSLREFVVRFARALGSLTVTTVPLIAAGVVLSSLIVPAAVRLSTGGAALAVVFVATVAVLIALPTFFEIPLAMLLVSLGAPGAATTMLVAGPIINLPSLFVLARETHPRLAVSLAAGIWLLAVAVGLAVTP
jgi:uncharacterized membrane protein YraQ (UPF0718 family)